MKTYRGIFAILFMMLSTSLFLMENAMAQPAAIAQVVWVKGSVKAIGENKVSRALERRSPIYEKDTIVTDSTGTGQIVFSDNGIMSLRTGTVFKIDQYKFVPKGNPKENKYIMSVTKGGFRTITGLISKSNPDGYKVNTPVATIGVRGTDYDIFLDEKGELQMEYHSGTPCVSNGGGGTCLSAANRYSSVANAKQAPKILKGQPAVFKNQPVTMTPATFSPTAAPAGGTMGTPPAGGGQQPPKSPSGPRNVSGFCIG